MRPLSVLIAIIFGSATAITFGLTATLFVLFVLKGRYPEFSREFAPLLWSSGVFLLLTAAAGASLYATLRARPWRWAACLCMCLILIGTGLLFWPKSL